MAKIDKAKEKLGEIFMTLANLLLVLFLFNTYMQKDNYSIGVVLLSVYGIVNLYLIGYILIKKANEE
ncbi:hypothetical protein [Sulfurimonas hydrogeniphila]|uniref:hypothetical protein n=1 Tax=Sulfurimonas hydrogeniphila TaxID=2509341 RepID=UPI00125F1052|nr:hypothetical protein [Sulfurimonas hydrogeniphila]